MKFIFIIFLLIPLVAFSQSKQRVKIDTHQLMDLLLKESSAVVLDNADVYFNSNLLQEYLNANKSAITYDSAGRIIISKGLTIKNSSINFYSQKIAMPLIWIENSTIETFWYENGNSVTPKGSKATILFIANSGIADLVLVKSLVRLSSYGNTYSNRSVKLLKTNLDDLSLNDDNLNSFKIDSCRIDQMSFRNSKLDTFTCMHSSINKMVIDGGEYSFISVSNNVLNEFVLNYPTISKSLLLNGNSFTRVSLKSSLEGFYFDIDWDQLKGNKIKSAVKSLDQNVAFVNSTDTSIVLNKEKYFPIVEVYSKLIARYKALGRLEDSNSAFIEFKDLEGARYRAQYRSTGGVNNYFRWRLNRLMKFYTEHGTDPSKAIIISIYVITLFGFFYVFFPSDWDTISKSKLIQRFNDFRQKNDKGYFKPFLLLVLGLIVSFLNAFTLSLNSFTTLGFGNIPTHGIARYVCVLEGFIGWFLLSIFTVALINQVLA